MTKNRPYRDLVLEDLTKQLDGQGSLNRELDCLRAVNRELVEAVRLVSLNYCPACGCDQANTPGCDHCRGLTKLRAAIAKVQEQRP